MGLTLLRGDLSLFSTRIFMADENPNLPPKPAEAAKIQPKKETVRINLPPKPSAPQTIKLPTLPPGGALTVSAAAPVAAPAPVVSVPAPAAPRPVAAPAPATAAARPTSAPAVARPSAPAMPGSAAPTARAPMVAAVSPIDKILAIAAAVVGLASLGSVIYLWQVVTT